MKAIDEIIELDEDVIKMHEELQKRIDNNTIDKKFCEKVKCQHYEDDGMFFCNLGCEFSIEEDCQYILERQVLNQK